MNVLKELQCYYGTAYMHNELNENERCVQMVKGSESEKHECGMCMYTTTVSNLCI